jgi:hypothetical protein
VIKPPSLVHNYTWIWSRDPALDAPPPSAPKKQQTEWARRLKTARETGIYGGVMKAGEQPTTFSLQSIPVDTWLVLVGLVESGALSRVEWPLYAARLALYGIEGTGLTEDADLTRRVEADFPRLGQMAPVAAFGQFGTLAHDIVNDMFGTIIERQSAPSPK